MLNSDYPYPPPARAGAGTLPQRPAPQRPVSQRPVSQRPVSQRPVSTPGFRPVGQQRPNQYLAPGVKVAEEKADEHAGLRKMAFRAGLAMLFVRLTVLPELLYVWLQANTYLLYVVGPPAILGALVTGAIGRTYQDRAARMWTGFFVCMILSLPGSTWAGGSFEDLKLYTLFAFPLLFVVGGLTTEWSAVRSLVSLVGFSGICFIGAAAVLAKPDVEGRLTMGDTTTTVGNSNDLASHVILLLPFILFIAMDKKRNSFVRYSMLLPIAYGARIVLATGSRGALIALAAMFLFVLFRGSAKQRMITMAATGLLAIAIPILVSGGAADRLATLFGAESANATLNQEAGESRDSREYLLRQSLIFTMEHPLLGVGMGQFSNYEGGHAVAAGQVGNWHETHNAFTEVSSECGVPALIFFVLGIGYAYGSVSKVYKKAKLAGHVEITNAAFCYLLAMTGYVVTIVFLSNAYRFYLPAMIGVAIALRAAADIELAAPVPASPLPQPVRRGAGWNGQPFPLQQRRLT